MTKRKPTQPREFYRDLVTAIGANFLRAKDGEIDDEVLRETYTFEHVIDERNFAGDLWVSLREQLEPGPQYVSPRDVLDFEARIEVEDATMPDEVKGYVRNALSFTTVEAVNHTLAVVVELLETLLKDHNDYDLRVRLERLTQGLACINHTHYRTPDWEEYTLHSADELLMQLAEGDITLTKES